MNNPWNFLADSFLASWDWFSGKNIFVAISLYSTILYFFLYAGLDEGEAASQYAFNTREREGGASLFGLKAYVPYLHRC